MPVGPAALPGDGSGRNRAGGRAKPVAGDGSMREQGHRGRKAVRRGSPAPRSWVVRVQMIRVHRAGPGGSSAMITRTGDHEAPGDPGPRRIGGGSGRGAGSVWSGPSAACRCRRGQRDVGWARGGIHDLLRVSAGRMRAVPGFVLGPGTVWCSPSRSRRAWRPVPRGGGGQPERVSATWAFSGCRPRRRAAEQDMAAGGPQFSTGLPLA